MKEVQGKKKKEGKEKMEKKFVISAISNTNEFRSSQDLEIALTLLCFVHAHHTTYYLLPTRPQEVDCGRRQSSFGRLRGGKE